MVAGSSPVTIAAASNIVSTMRFCLTCEVGMLERALRKHSQSNVALVGLVRYGLPHWKSMDAVSLLLELAKLGAVGLVAGLFTSYLGNKDHRRRSWWEMRVAAYREVIEALSDLVNYSDHHFKAELRGRELPEGFKAKLEEQWAPARARVRKAADTGAFLFSKQAATALAEFERRDNEEQDSYIDAVLESLEAGQVCLQRMVELSRTDLEIQPTFLERLGWRLTSR